MSKTLRIAAAILGVTIALGVVDAVSITSEAGIGAAEDITLRAIPASATDPAIDDLIGEHLVALGPAQTRAGRLMVWYPGTGARPGQYTLFITHAAELGYHAIGLAYDNRDAINYAICPGKPQDCYEKSRVEILTGVESGYSPPNVGADNAAFNRLTKLLQHLDAQYPGEGWGAYLSGGEPRWDLIVFGGHSQGGGHSAMTAKLHEVARALLFGATEPMLWTTGSFATPKERFYGFAHELEQSYTPITNSWANIAIPGALVNVDAAPHPYEGSHRLSTAFAECRGNPSSNGYYHNCPIVDEYTPLDEDGRSVFQPVWDYMLGADELTPAAGVGGDAAFDRGGGFPMWAALAAGGAIAVVAAWTVALRRLADRD